MRSVNRDGTRARQRPPERRASGEVDVVADQHRLSDRVARVDAARRVGKHDGAAPGRDRGAHAVHDRVRVMPFKKMNAPEVQQHPPLPLLDIPNGWCVTPYARLLKTAEFREWHFDSAAPIASAAARQPSQAPRRHRNRRRRRARAGPPRSLPRG